MTEDRCILILRQIKSLIEQAIQECDGIARTKKKPIVSDKRQGATLSGLSFKMNALAFMNKNARGLSGPQKFTLLVARLVEGSTSKQIASTDVQKHWNKMKGVLGGKFNPAYANRAKVNGWVDGPKHGTYVLSENWKSALEKNNE